MAKELSKSGYVRASAETEAGRGEYGCIYTYRGVYLRPYVLNIKKRTRGRKHGEAIFIHEIIISIWLCTSIS